jgi:hypothetical protein
VDAPSAGRVGKGLAALRREREEAFWQRQTTRPKTAKPTSISIARKAARMRTIGVDISPYPLAPATGEFVAALNADAKRHGFEVTFTARTNWIEITGEDIEEAASDPTTLVGWFLHRARAAGYLEGKEQILRRANSEWRRYLRRHAKTKAGIAEAAKVKAGVERQAAFIRASFMAGSARC